MNLDEAIEAQHEAMQAIATGDPEPTKALYSDADDVTLANPFGPAVRGQSAVHEMLDFVGTQFRDGVFEGVEQLAVYAGSTVASTLEIESWRVKVGGRSELSPFVLRVTCTYRREGDTWKLVSRHADPINSRRPDGPLQT